MASAVSTHLITPSAPDFVTRADTSPTMPDNLPADIAAGKGGTMTTSIVQSAGPDMNVTCSIYV